MTIGARSAAATLNPLMRLGFWVSIDPGLRHTAVAVWEGTRLIRAGLVRNTVAAGVRDAPAWAAMGDAVWSWIFAEYAFRVDSVVVEIPQVYSTSRGVNPDDLLQLVGVDGAILGRLHGATPVSYRPAAWKGQTPKDITQKRTEAALTPEERGSMEMPAASLQHNVWDSVALGLAHLRLTGKTRK